MLEQASRRRQMQPGRSQLATELLLTAFAAIGAVIVLRTVLVVLQISDRIWIGQFVYRLTRPVTDLLAFIPGGERTLFVGLNTLDITLLALIPLFVLGIIATGGRNDSR